MFLFLLYLHTNRIIMSSKNRFMGRQWFPDSITFRKELKKMLTFSWDFALGKHPKATMRWLIIPVGVSSERFCTKYLSLGYATWSHTSLRCGKCLFVNVIHPFFFFFQIQENSYLSGWFFCSFCVLVADERWESSVSLKWYLKWYFLAP